MRTLLGWPAVSALLLGGFVGGLAACTGPVPGATASSPSPAPVESLTVVSPTPVRSPAAEPPVPEPAASESPAPAPTLPPGTFTLQATSPDVGPADLALIERLVVFALDPADASAQTLGLAQAGVRLGLADRLLVDLQVASAADPAAWEIDDPLFRAHTGPFSAPAMLAARIEGTDRRPPLPAGGALTVTVGEHPHCTSGPVPAPLGLESLRQVSVQPTDESMASCLDWFTVDLFVADDGAVVAVTLDVWEP